MWFNCTQTVKIERYDELGVIKQGMQPWLEVTSPVVILPIISTISNRGTNHQQYMYDTILNPF